MKKFFLTAIAALALATVNVTAAPIVGSVGITGNLVAPIEPSATSITFSLIGGATGIVTTSSGDLLAPILTFVQGSSLTLSEANAVGYVFDFGGLYSFTVSGFAGGNLVSIAPSAIPGSLSINLVGEYSKAGFDNTGGTLNLSFQYPQSANPSTYSGDGSTVPEPSTYAMLGTALLGLGYLRRRKA